MHLKKESFPPTSQLKFIKVWMTAPFWRADRMRYRPGVEIALAKRWALDVFYCYQYESPKGKHIAGVEIGYSF